MIDEPVEWECKACGWRYPVAGAFDGRHGIPEPPYPPCDELAEPITQEVPEA